MIDPLPTVRAELPAGARPGQRADDRLREAAVRLEATFLAEMLKSGGSGKVSESFGGGEGEEQFASLMRDQQALAMARAGGIGLTEAILSSMMRSDGDGRG